MGIGGSIVLIAIGAVLAFAVHATPSGVDLSLVGWILMGAGALGLIVSLIVFGPRYRSTRTVRRGSIDEPAEDVEVREV